MSRLGNRTNRCRRIDGPIDPQRKARRATGSAARWLRVCARRAPLHARRAERCGRRRDCAMTVAVGGGARTRLPCACRHACHARPRSTAPPRESRRRRRAPMPSAGKQAPQGLWCAEPPPYSGAATLTAEGFRPTQRRAVRVHRRTFSSYSSAWATGEAAALREALGRTASYRYSQCSAVTGRTGFVTVCWNTHCSYI
jgi:hypothetical protein